ncbi:MAG: hypothetical protein LBM73_03155 [Candidatus Nomurabacteria bacterium]|jgi:hypothetical protein|nr:hypothetical protein [Candidatus Nomurabacteria bacterium]
MSRVGNFLRNHNKAVALVAASTLAGATTLGLGGCADGGERPTPSPSDVALPVGDTTCLVYDQTGHRLHPTDYPIGTATIAYNMGDFYEGIVDTVKGQLIKDNKGQYRIIFNKKLVEKASSYYNEYHFPGDWKEEYYGKIHTSKDGVSFDYEDVLPSLPGSGRKKIVAKISANNNTDFMLTGGCFRPARLEQNPVLLNEKWAAGYDITLQPLEESGFIGYSYQTTALPVYPASSAPTATLPETPSPSPATTTATTSPNAAKPTKSN